MNDGEENARNLREMAINHPLDEETESIRGTALGGSLLNRRTVDHFREDAHFRILLKTA
ncbi:MULTISPECIES: hypothetical protein [Pseudomonas]|uniref:hypothetical protein n=1 Tax=Pseudomonas TaxID=286 RepID=UPI001FF15937|nr:MULTISPECIES: hypothetical protein [unclassified Pseudomonas]